MEVKQEWNLNGILLMVEYEDIVTYDYIPDV